MTSSFVRRQNVCTTSLGLFLVSWLPASAAPAGEQAAEQVEEIVVTGTRIRQQPGQDSASPITSVSTEDIRLSGQVSVENILNEMPQLIADNNESSNFPGAGIATLDLRGLGTNRNLVLVNGRRMTPSVQDGTVDVNNIPIEMVDRIEVVTGGASSTYGSDAMSGVVNFILKDRFSGVQTQLGVGTSTHGDGTERSASALVGVNVGDTGNILFDVAYFRRDRILESARDFSQVDVAALIGYSVSASGFPWQGGSPSGTPSIVNTPSNPNPRLSTSTTLSDGTNCNAVQGPSRTLVPTASGVRGFCQVISTFGGDRYNFAPISDLVIPQTRWNVAAIGNLPIGDGPITAYYNALYVHNETSNQRAPAALGAYSDVTIDPASPLLNAATQAALASRPDPAAPAFLASRLTAFGPQVFDFTSDFGQFSGGVRGSLFADWKWDIYGAYSRVKFRSAVNDVARDRLQAEFDSCPTGSGSGCVAQSPFTAFAAAAIDYAALPRVTDQTLFERTNFAFDMNGTLTRLPAGPLQGAVGAEFRRDSSTYTPDGEKAALNGQGNLIGSFAALPVAGSFNVKELYSEIQAPLITNRVIDSLTLLLGVRGSDYSSVGRISTEKIGLTFEPLRDSGLRVRGMFQVATRAPSLAELYAAASQSRPGVQDPCDRRFFDGTSTTESRCNGTLPVIGLGGKPIASVDPNSFQALSTLVNAYSTGNPALRPETAHTVTLGMNWKPDYIRDLYASVDYYRIKIDDYISNEFGGAQQITNACFQNGNADACKILSRDASGNIVIGDPAVNQGIQPQNGSSLKTAGEDIYLAYAITPGSLLGPGRLSLALNGNHLDSWEYVARDGTRTQCAGVMCAAATSFASQPKWRGLFAATFRISDLTAQWRVRYVGSLSDSLLGGQDYLGTLNNGHIPRIPAFVYHDLMIGYDHGQHLSITGSISNLFNKQPPVLYDAGSQDNTDVMLYNVIGRYFRLTLQARF